MSRRELAHARAIAGSSLPVLVLVACSSHSAPHGDPSGEDVSPQAQAQQPAQHVSLPASSTASGPPTATSSTPRPPAQYTDPVRVAVAEASTVCNFDWQQSFADRRGAAARYATTDYVASSIDGSGAASRWQDTQSSRESAVCADAAGQVDSSAPNTSTVRFVRVTMTQQITAPAISEAASPFAVMYRVQLQTDGRWLVAGESDGG
jgi:hypothetical protein